MRQQYCGNSNHERSAKQTGKKRYDDTPNDGVTFNVPRAVIMGGLGDQKSGRRGVANIQAKN